MWKNEVRCCPAAAYARSNSEYNSTAAKQAKQPATSTATESPRGAEPQSQMFLLEKILPCETWPLNGASVQLIFYLIVGNENSARKAWRTQRRNIT